MGYSIAMLVYQRVVPILKPIQLLKDVPSIWNVPLIGKGEIQPYSFLAYWKVLVFGARVDLKSFQFLQLPVIVVSGNFQPSCCYFDAIMDDNIVASRRLKNMTWSVMKFTKWNIS